MKGLPVLNFPAYKFRLQEGKGSVRIWDDLRKCWLQLTPEEWVRQHTLRFLIEKLGVHPQYIRMEYPVSISGMPQRADIVVKDRNGEACLLVECKAAEVALSQKTLDQLIRYNSVVQSPYIMMTNGLKHACFRAAEVCRYEPLSQFPDLSEFFRIE